MSLVKTDGCQEKFEISGTAQLARILRGAEADELSAINLYDRVIESLEKTKGADETIAELKEIRADECNHQGRLQRLIMLYDKEGAEGFAAGMKGKDK